MPAMSLSQTIHPMTAESWDEHATDYTRLFAPLTGHFVRGMISLVQARLPAGPEPSQWRRPIYVPS